MRVGTVLACGLAAILGAKCPALAEKAVDPRDLELRIALSQIAVWPELRVKVQLRGCEIRLELESPEPDSWTRTNILWLADLQTSPAQVWRDEGQQMADGGQVWTEYDVGYRWKPAALAENADAVARWQADHGRILAAGDAMLLTAPAVSDSFHRLQEAASDGLYGPFFQRNQAWGEWVDPLYGQSFWSGEVVHVDKDQGETAFSPLRFVYSHTEVDGLIMDLHRYALQACNPVG